MSKSAFWVLAFLITLTVLPGSAEVDILGYLENRFYLIHNGEESGPDIPETFNLAYYNRVRTRLKAQPAREVTVHLAVDFFSFQGIFTSPLGTTAETGETGSENPDIRINLDRAYVDLHFKSFDLTVGKQRVAMGVSYLWAPLDVFNRINVFEPKEEKPGVNAFRLYVPLGDFSSITGIFSPEDRFGTSKSGLRIKTQVLGTGLGFSFIHDGIRETAIYGLDLRGENFLGWWIEVGAFIGQEEKDLKTVLGFDYTFPLGMGLYWLNEFYYDSSGATDPELYRFDSLLEGNRFTLARLYFFSMLRYGFSDFISGTLAYIGNWTDGSYIINPGFQYDLFRNTSVSAGLYLPFGNAGGELNRTDRSVVYLWLKIYF